MNNLGRASPPSISLATQLLPLPGMRPSDQSEDSIPGLASNRRPDRRERGGIAYAYMRDRCPCQSLLHEAGGREKRAEEDAGSIDRVSSFKAPPCTQTQRPTAHKKRFCYIRPYFFILRPRESKKSKYRVYMPSPILKEHIEFTFH